MNAIGSHKGFEEVLVQDDTGNMCQGQRLLQFFFHAGSGSQGRTLSEEDVLLTALAALWRFFGCSWRPVPETNCLSIATCSLLENLRIINAAKP